MPTSVGVFWRSYRIAVQRAWRDRRARSYATKATLFFLCLLVYVLFIVYMVSDRWNGIFYAFIFGTGTLAARLMRRSHRKQDELLNCSLTGRDRLHPQDASAASPEVSDYLQQRILTLASLLARGASEVYLRYGEHGPGLRS